MLPQAQSDKAVTEVLPPAETPARPVLDFITIGENNLFHPERKIPIEKTVQELPRPDLVLYGTIISDGSGMAFIENKRSPRITEGRGKRQTVIKKGDMVSGFVLKEILADRILLAQGDESMTVYLVEQSKRRGGESPAKAAPAPAAAGASPTVSAAAASQPHLNLKTNPPQYLPPSPAPALVSPESRRGRVYRGQQ